MALSPYKFRKLKQADLVHLHARISLDAPQQIGAVPGREMMPAGSIPEKPKHVAHGEMIRERVASS